jgi:hypothetical protein
VILTYVPVNCCSTMIKGCERQQGRCPLLLHQMLANISCCRPTRANL